MSLTYILTRVTQNTLCIIVLMNIATIQHLNNTDHDFFFFLTHFAICFTFRHTVTLKQGQGHQTWCDYVGPTQGYSHAKFESSHFKSVQEKVNFLL